MTAPATATPQQADPRADPPGTAGPLRAAMIQLGLLLGLGALVGVLWAVLSPVVSRASDGIERTIAGEVTMAGLGLAAGLAVAAVGLIRPGGRPVLAAAVRLVGSVAASLTAWGAGRLIGAPVLGAPGVVLIWPLATALATTLVTLGIVLRHPDAHD